MRGYIEGGGLKYGAAYTYSTTAIQTNTCDAGDAGEALLVDMKLEFGKREEMFELQFRSGPALSAREPEGMFTDRGVVGFCASSVLSVPRSCSVTVCFDTCAAVEDRDGCRACLYRVSGGGSDAVVLHVVPAPVHTTPDTQ